MGVSFRTFRVVVGLDHLSAIIIVPRPHRFYIVDPELLLQLLLEGAQEEVGMRVDGLEVGSEDGEDVDHRKGERVQDQHFFLRGRKLDRHDDGVRGVVL